MFLISKCNTKWNRGQEESYQYSKYSILWRENAMSPACHGTNWPRPRRNAKNCKKNQVVLSNWWEKDLWQHTLALLQVHDRTQMNKLTRNSSKSNKRQVASVFSWCTQSEHKTKWEESRESRVIPIIQMQVVQRDSCARHSTVLFKSHARPKEFRTPIQVCPGYEKNKPNCCLVR